MIIHVFTKVAAVFLMLAVGGLARLRRIITDEALENLCKIVLYVTLPFLFIHVLSTRCTREAISALWMAPFFAIAIIFTGFFVGRLASALLKIPKKKRDTLSFLTAFQNSGFLAIPIGFVLFGERGVLTVVMFTLGFNILYWTFGVHLMSRSNPTHKINPLKGLLSPAIIALILGIIFGITRTNLPGFFMDGSKLLGNATVPLAMLVVGAMMVSGRSKNKINIKEISAIILCRLIIVPVIFLVIAKSLSGISDLMRSIIVLQACMPSASSSPLLAKQYNGDYDLAASGVFFTTLVSIITIPIFMGLI